MQANVFHFMHIAHWYAHHGNAWKAMAYAAVSRPYARQALDIIEGA
jgi:hypothetical protein